MLVQFHWRSSAGLRLLPFHGCSSDNNTPHKPRNWWHSILYWFFPPDLQTSFFLTLGFLSHFLVVIWGLHTNLHVGLALGWVSVPVFFVPLSLLGFDPWRNKPLCGPVDTSVLILEFLSPHTFSPCVGRCLPWRSYNSGGWERCENWNINLKFFSVTIVCCICDMGYPNSQGEKD